jgi:hypothetical protein
LPRRHETGKDGLTVLQSIQSELPARWFRKPYFQQRCFSHCIGFGEHSEDDRHVFRHICRSRRPDGAVRDERISFLLCPVIDDEIMIFLLEVGSHAASHDAQSNEPDFHKSSSYNYENLKQSTQMISEKADKPR